MGVPPAWSPAPVHANVVVATGSHFIAHGLASVVLPVAAAGLTLMVPSQRPARITRRAEASAGS